MRDPFRKVLLIILLSGMGQQLYVEAQAERISEEEIKRQNLFIEANKEKLMGRFDQAKDLYLKLYREDRQNDVVAYELAKVFAALEEEEDAEKYIKSAIKINPSQEYYYRFYIDFLERGDRKAELLELLEDVVDLYPSQERYHIALAELYANNGNINKSIDIYDEMENSKGVREEISHRKFEWYRQLDDEKNALKELERLVANYPGNVRFMNNLASYLLEIDQEKRALQIYQEVLALDSDNDRAQMAMASKEISEATGSAQLLSSLKPLIENRRINIDQKIFELLPYLETPDQDPELEKQLLDLLSKLQEVHPDEAKAYAIYGDALMKSRQLEAAIQQYKRTIELNPSVFLVWEQLLFALAEVNSYEDLADYSSRSLDYYPNQAINYYFYGLSQYHLDRFPEAADYLSEGILYSAKDPVLQYRMYFLAARNELAQSHSTKALQYGESAMELLPGSGREIHELLGDIYFQMVATGRAPQNDQDPQLADLKKKATDHWQRALELGGDAERINLKINELQTFE